MCLAHAERGHRRRPAARGRRGRHRGTVGGLRSGTAAGLREAEADVTARLPVTTRIEQALLIHGTSQPESWRTVATLPLGEGP
ncbi:MAG: hypothetical protein ABI776_18220 [Nocardioidaceae bacterium]